MAAKDKIVTLAKKAGPPLLLLLLVFLFFPRLFMLSDLPAAKDVVTFSFPYQCEYWRALHQWDFP
ncbi:MAG: hypothetical protein L0213_02940, partial [Candidatus Dadabacteria bacterium]|nr:hypothetical protein [Candidatus Dadabacteria bacterium]